MNNITEKKILVTGASSGIGLALCKSLISSGNHVYAIGRDKEKVTELLRFEFFHFIPADLSATLKIEEIYTEHLKNIKLDGLVHCAGMEETIPLTLYDPEKVNDIFKINVFSGIELLRLFSKKKYSNDGASVVLFSSVMSELGQPGKLGYCSSKAAILGVVRSMALELARRKFRVNAISPGVVQTPMTEKLFELITEENRQKIIDMHPLGIGVVEDVIPLVVFLLSDDSKWITGQNLKIDGGYSIQ